MNKIFKNSEIEEINFNNRINMFDTPPEKDISVKLEEVNKENIMSALNAHSPESIAYIRF